MNLPKTIHESWTDVLTPLFEDIKMQMILDTISKDKFYPVKENVFKVFAIPMDKIKVVMLGQDPYSKGEATGLAFGARSTGYMPASLKIIREEILRSKANLAKDMFYTAEWQTLHHWWKQGVFLYNSALTVESSRPNSHTDIWQWFTRVIINTISLNVKPVWVLWGTKAQSYETYISNNKIVNDNLEEISKDINSLSTPRFNYIIKGYHPAAQSYDANTPYKFTGCDHFNICNDVLRILKQQEIYW